KQELPFSYNPDEVEEMVSYSVLQEILQSGKSVEEMKDEFEKRLDELIPKHILIQDIFASINYNLGLNYNLGMVDDIDHLGNRRLRSVGELLQNQFRIGLSRMERVVKERMTIQGNEAVTPQGLINIRPV